MMTSEFSYYFPNYKGVFFSKYFNLSILVPSHQPLSNQEHFLNIFFHQKIVGYYCALWLKQRLNKWIFTDRYVRFPYIFFNYFETSRAISLFFCF